MFMTHAAEIKVGIDPHTLPKSKLVDDHVAADILGVSRGTLAVWRSTGRYGLAFCKIGRRVKYRVADLLDFIDRHTKTHTGE
jgi:predicted site-specific integrase-resolvase